MKSLFYVDAYKISGATFIGFIIIRSVVSKEVRPPLSSVSGLFILMSLESSCYFFYSGCCAMLLVAES